MAMPNPVSMIAAMVAPQGGITLEDIRDLCRTCTREMTLQGQLCQYTSAEVEEVKQEVLGPPGVRCRVSIAWQLVGCKQAGA